MKNYTKDLNTYLFRRSWGELINAMSDEEAGKLLKAIYLYADGVEISADQLGTELLACVCRMIIRQLNHSSKKHLKRLSEFSKAEICQDASQE